MPTEASPTKGVYAQAAPTEISAWTLAGSRALWWMLWQTLGLQAFRAFESLHCFAVCSVLCTFNAAGKAPQHCSWQESCTGVSA